MTVPGIFSCSWNVYFYKKTNVFLFTLITQKNFELWLHTFFQVENLWYIFSDFCFM
jgi:hypothetical protein